MNYFRLIKAFYNSQLTNRLSVGQQALWHALAFINNSCNWKEWFTAANFTLESFTDLSRNGIVKCRNVLKQKGYIDFQSNGTKATSYKIEDITKQYIDKEMRQACQLSAQVGVQVGVQDSVQDSVQVGGTLKNLTKQNKTEHSAREAALAFLFLFYEENGFGAIARSVAEEIGDYLDRGVDCLLIRRCLKEAVDNGAAKWAYARKVLDNCLAKKIKTAEAFDAEAARRSQSKNTGAETLDWREL